jgi:hypothetical protein
MAMSNGVNGAAWTAYVDPFTTTTLIGDANVTATTNVTVTAPAGNAAGLVDATVVCDAPMNSLAVESTIAIARVIVRTTANCAVNVGGITISGPSLSAVLLDVTVGATV